MLDKPTFPADFCQDTFQTKVNDREEQRQKQFLEDDMKRIYNEIMPLKDQLVCRAATFKFNSSLCIAYRKYILEEILKRFPDVKYVKSAYYDKDIDAMSNEYHTITKVTDDDVKLDYEYLIKLGCY